MRYRADFTLCIDAKNKTEKSRLNFVLILSLPFLIKRKRKIGLIRQKKY